MPTQSRPERKGIMLAYPAQEGRIDRLGPEFIGQPKYRGQRGITHWFANEPHILSSYQNPFQYIEHILEALKETETTLQFDGEIYNHNWSQQELNSVANRTTNRHPKAKDLEYHIFDINDPSLQQETRLQVLEYLQLKGKIRPPLYISQYEVLTKDTWQLQAQQWVDEGYEGIILRKLTGYYKERRSIDLLKFKPSEQDEYTILEVYEAISKDGIPKGMAGGFIVHSDDNTLFRVGAGKMSHEERTRIWKTRQQQAGRQLVVKHEPITTEKGIPLCAVAVEIH